MTDITPVDTTIIGNQRFLCQKDNLCADATITASATKSASGTVTASNPVRSGNSVGTVSLTGDYTDNDDATFDVEIRSGTGTTRRTSQPVFVGAGIGTELTSATATAAVPAQNITARLIDLGISDRYAKLDFYGYTLKSKIGRAGGNAITITNDRSGITYSNSGNSAPAAMTQDEHRFEGPGYDFGGAYGLDADGQIHPDTKRFSFGSDPRVYRQYRRFEEGKEVYIVDPPLARSVAENAVIKSVTGTYAVTVAVIDSAWVASTAYASGDVATSGGKVFQATVAGTSGGSEPSFDSSELGATTSDSGITWSFVAASSSETYSNLVTFFDLIKALLGSGLVEIVGPGDTPPVLIQDKTPGGIDAEDIPFLTNSFHLGFDATGSDNIKTITDIGLNAANAERNEQISIRCTSNRAQGAESWDVIGSGSGSMGAAVTGSLFFNKGVQFTIPKRSATNQVGETADPVTGDVTISSTSFAADNGTDTTFPQACVREYVLGPNAKPIDITFEYRPRPADGCTCENATITGALDASCVGADPVNVVRANILGGAELATIPATIQSRISELWSWYSNKIDGLTFLYTIANGREPGAYEYQYKNNAVMLSNILAEFQSALYDLQAIPTALAAYDAVFVELLADAQLQKADDAENSLEFLRTDGSTYPDQYRQKLNKVRADAGLQPNFSQPSGGSGSVSGSDCWVNDESATHWWVATGSDGRSYPPMFTNQPYYLVKEVHDAAGNQRFVSLDMAGFVVAIGCDDHVSVGDTITVSILPEAGESSIADNRFYQLGDTFLVDIVARKPLQMQNGRSGDNNQTWSVHGDVYGAYSGYTVNTESPAAYSDDGLGFTINVGNVPSAIGDTLSFAVMLNQFRWRKNADAWSADMDIDATVALSDGLSANFGEGAGVSYQDGDSFAFTVVQPYSPSHAALPSREYWSPGASGGTLTFEFANDQVVDMIAVAWHLLPAGATITARLLDSGDSELYSTVLVHNKNVIFDSLDTAQSSVRKLEIIVSGADNFWLAWVWCGQSVYLNADADELIIRPSKLMLRGSNAIVGRHIADGYTGRLEYRGQWQTNDETGFLSESDINKLTDIFDYIKLNNDQPIGLIPNTNYDEGYLLHWEGDTFEPVDQFAFNLNNRDQRVQSTSIEFSALYQ